MKKGFTLIEFLVGMAMSAFIFIVATNLVVNFMGINTKSKRSEDIEQVKSDILSELTDSMQWASYVSFDGTTLKVDSTSYKIDNGAFTKNNVALTNGSVSVSNFEVKRYSNSSAVNSSSPGTGLVSKYFDNSDFTNLKTMQTDSNIDFNWGNASPMASINKDSFSVEWSGAIRIPSPGLYTFITRSDDGVRLWIDNALIVDTLSGVGSQSAQGSVAFSKVTNANIRMQYVENNNLANVSLLWSGPTIPQSIVPQEVLYPVETQTSYEVNLDITHTDNPDVHDKVNLYVSPRFN